MLVGRHPKTKKMARWGLSPIEVNEDRLPRDSQEGPTAKMWERQEQRFGLPEYRRLLSDRPFIFPSFKRPVRPSHF